MEREKSRSKNPFEHKTDLKIKSEIRKLKQLKSTDPIPVLIQQFPSTYETPPLDLTLTRTERINYFQANDKKNAEFLISQLEALGIEKDRIKFHAIANSISADLLPSHIGKIVRFDQVKMVRWAGLQDLRAQISLG